MLFRYVAVTGRKVFSACPELFPLPLLRLLPLFFLLLPSPFRLLPFRCRSGPLSVLLRVMPPGLPRRAKNQAGLSGLPSFFFCRMLFSTGGCGAPPAAARAGRSPPGGSPCGRLSGNLVRRFFFSWFMSVCPGEERFPDGDYFTGRANRAAALRLVASATSAGSVPSSSATRAQTSGR